MCTTHLKMMHDFVANDWGLIARTNGLDSFESIWTLDIGWFEEPNERRGGWSGVSRYEIELPDGRREGIFIKRQQNHITRFSCLTHKFIIVDTKALLPFISNIINPPPYAFILAAIRWRSRSRTSLQNCMVGFFKASSS